MAVEEEKKKDNLYLLTTQWLVAQIVRPWEVHGSREFCIIAPRCNNSSDRRWNKSHQRGCVYRIIIINYETPAILQLELTNANIIATMQCPVQYSPDTYSQSIDRWSMVDGWWPEEEEVGSLKVLQQERFYGDDGLCIENCLFDP